MLNLLAGGATLLRHWKIAMLGVALLLAGWSQNAKLRAERALERCRGEAALTAVRLERADQAAEALRRDSRRRDAEQSRLLRQARRDNQGEADRIAILRRSAAVPREGGDCRPSNALRELENRL
ncbi:MAG TPA: hypothetical protein VFO69_01910 [Allosphingosinicella sp.]|nr:hypothetical protein [Allosphingosinicella sp.]